MQLTIATTLLACTTAQVQAFSDSSPFVLFSTAELPALPDSGTQQQPAQLQTSTQVLAAAKALLATCPTRRYVLVSQPNVHAADIRDAHPGWRGTGSWRMPHLGRAVLQATADKSKNRVFAVAEVIGQVSGRPLAEYIAGACRERKGVEAVVERVELRHLPPPAAGERRERREEVVEDNDHELGKLLNTLDGDYTVLIFSDPNEVKAYEPEFSEPVHMDLKRWSEEPELVARRKSNSTSSLPLFEKYQFFTPGIFMAFVVLAVLLSILAVGLKAIASLEVSYGAFEKEMGPAAQKKQM